MNSVNINKKEKEAPLISNRGQAELLGSFSWCNKTNDVVCLRSTGLSHPIITFQGAGREQLFPTVVHTVHQRWV